MTDINSIFWARLASERQERILLTFRVTALEEKDARPSISIEFPRTLLDWYELIKSIEKVLVWAIPRIILPAWGMIQSFWPWFRDTALPFLRMWLGW